LTSDGGYELYATSTWSVIRVYFLLVIVTSGNEARLIFLFVFFFLLRVIKDRSRKRCGIAWEGKDSNSLDRLPMWWKATTTSMRETERCQDRKPRSCGCP
jgi:hypothetical protein